MASRFRLNGPVVGVGRPTCSPFPGAGMYYRMRNDPYPGISALHKYCTLLQQGLVADTRKLLLQSYSTEHGILIEVVYILLQVYPRQSYCEFGISF